MKPVLLSVALSQSMPEDIRRYGGLVAVLELGEQVLQATQYMGGVCACGEVCGTCTMYVNMI